MCYDLFFLNFSSSFQDHSFLSVSEKADRETLNTIEDTYYSEDNFDPKEYELQVIPFFYFNDSHIVKLGITFIIQW